MRRRAEPEVTRNLRGRELERLVRKREPQMIERLQELVAVESPSQDKAAVDRAVAMAAEWARGNGAAVRLHPFREHGSSVEARFGPRVRGTKPVLLLGHLDTVWPVGTLRRMPFRVEKERISGPGVLDMKAGVVMALTALELLREADALRRPVTLLLHGDEEIGSPASRRLTERLGAGCAAVFVLEPAQGAEGAYKTARKGVGHYRLQVQGVAAHAGVDFAAGHSAILELGRQLAAVAALGNAARGTTVNPGVVGGGTASNVVAAEAWAEIDLRVTGMREAARMDRALRRLRAQDTGCTLTVTGGLNRPPMVRSRAGAALFRRAQGLAGEMGMRLEEAATGGGSDGNFTAALGVPTLDGMGAVGAGAHAVHEHLLRAHWTARTALLAAMLL